MRASRDQIRDTYAVTGKPPMLSGVSSRSFQPEEVTLYQQDDMPVRVTVAGSDVDSPAVWVQTGYQFNRHGRIQPHSKTGDAPAWLVELVHHALANVAEEVERR